MPGSCCEGNLRAQNLCVLVETFLEGWGGGEVAQILDRYCTPQKQKVGT